LAAGLGADLGVAAAAFVGTNIDNCMVTMALVAGAPLERARRIALGQVIGFALLVAVAAAAAALLFEFSAAVVGLLGLVPLALGLRGLVGLARSPAAGEDEAGTGRGRRLRPLRPEQRAVGRSLTAAALVTIAAGGDNLAVYIPLFRVGGATNIGAIVAVFVVGEVLVTWLVLAGGRHPKARAVMLRLGHWAVPVLLCCIGLLVMVQAGTFSLF
jgi:cadmium resistance protein CadD (predicted permease)